MLKSIIILITVSAIAKGFCDSIMFHPGNFLFQGDWWLANGNYAWNNRSWLEKTIFSFISDGWHLFDAVRITSMLIIIALLIVDSYKPVQEKPFEYHQGEKFYIDHNKWLAVIGIIILAYIYHGLIFTLTFWIL